MATTKDQLTIEIAVNSEKAVKSLDKINDTLKDVSDSAKETKNSVGGFGLGLVKLQAGIGLATQAFGAIKDVMGGVIEAFQESYDATVKLQQALEITGSRSVNETVNAFKGLGAEFVRLGISSDETVLNLARMGTAAGISSDKLQKMLKVAADLSVARDIPLTTAFTALTKSLKGSSIAIAQFIPELSELSAEQNKAGVALEYLDSQYSGFASRNLETFSGKIAAQKETWSELIETIGSVTNEIFDLGSGLDSTTKKISAVNASIEENRIKWVAAGQAIVSLFKGIADTVIKAFMSIVGMIERTLGVAIAMFGWLQSATDKFGKRKDMGASISKFGEELYAMGLKNKEAFDDLNLNLNATDDELKTVSNTVVRTREELLKARDAAKAFNDKLQNAELLKRVEDYNTALALAGKTGLDLIRAKEVEDLKELDRLAEKIKGTQGLGKANQALLATAKANVSAASAASAAELQKKSLDELTAKTIDYQKTVNSFNTTQRQQIQFELDAELQKLDIARKKAQLENNPAAIAEIDKQAGLATEAAGKKTAAAPSNMFEGLKKTGEQVAGQISGVMSEGLMGMAAGAASAAGSIMSAIEGLLNIVPSLLNQAANILNMIRDFPETIVTAINGLFDAIASFIPGLIRGLIDSVFNLLTNMKDFINNFVNGIADLIADLPNILIHIINDLPEIIWSLAENIVKAVIKLAKVIILDLVPNIVKGIWKGLSKFLEGMKRVLSGKSFSVKAPKIDPAPLVKAVKKLSGDSSKLFAVNDMMDGAKDAISSVTDTIKGAFKKGRDEIKAVWQWVIDKVWGPLKGLVENAWQFVLKLWEGLKTIVEAAWAFVELLWHGLEEVVKIAWKFVGDLWEGLKNVVSQAWQFVKDLWEGLKNVVSQAWQFVKDIFDGLAAGVKVAFQFVKDIFDGLKAVVTSAFDGIKTIGSDIWEGFKTAISGGADFIKGFGTKIWDGLKEGLGGLGKIFSDMFETLNPANLMQKVFNFDGATGQGTVEKALNIDIPFLNFARGGVVPGQSTVRGDSIKNDNVIAMLSPGEVVIPRSKMDDPRTRKIIQDVMSGAISPPGFAKGLTISTPQIKIPTMNDIVDTVTKAGDDIAAAVEVAAGQASDAGAILNQQVISGVQVAIDQASGVAQGAGDWLGDVFNGANPLKQLWETVSDKVKKEMLDPMFQKNRFAAGGPVGSDTVPAMLTPGEFIMSRPAVNSIGLDNLRSMNAGKPVVAGNQTVNIEINFNDAQIGMDKNLIRDKLLPEIRDALKRASLNGEFVLSNKGIRA